MVSRDRLVVRTLRCGRSNPASNPGPDMSFLKLLLFLFLPSCKKIVNLRIFPCCNYEFSETLPKDIILLETIERI